MLKSYRGSGINASAAIQRKPFHKFEKIVNTRERRELFKTGSVCIPAQQVKIIRRTT
jgi:hypothetical protein